MSYRHKALSRLSALARCYCIFSIHSIGMGATDTVTTELRMLVFTDHTGQVDCSLNILRIPCTSGPGRACDPIIQRSLLLSCLCVGMKAINSSAVHDTRSRVVE